MVCKPLQFLASVTIYNINGGSMRNGANWLNFHDWHLTSLSQLKPNVKVGQFF